VRTEWIKDGRTGEEHGLKARVIRVISLCFTPRTGVQVSHTELSTSSHDTTPTAKAQCVGELPPNSRLCQPYFAMWVSQSRGLLTLSRPCLAVCLILFETCTDLYWLVLTRTDLYWPVLTRTDLYWLILTCTDLYWLVLTRTDLYWLVLTCTDLYWLVLTCTDLYWLSLTRTDSYWLVLTCTDSYWRAVLVYLLLPVDTQQQT